MNRINRKSWMPLIILSVFTFLHINPSQARVFIKERTKYYNVTGKTGVQLYRSIIARGPKLSKTGHAIATTRTSIDVKNIRPKFNRRKCGIASVDVYLTLTYTYPRWKGANRASAKVRKNWKAFEARLVRHEKQHGTISKQYARELEKKIKRLTGSVSRKCADFERRAINTISKLQKTFAGRHARFDRREGRAFSRIRRLEKRLLRSR